MTMPILTAARFVHVADQVDAAIEREESPPPALVEEFRGALAPGLFPPALQDRLERELRNFFYCHDAGATGVSIVHLRAMVRIL